MQKPALSNKQAKKNKKKKKAELCSIHLLQTGWGKVKRPLVVE